MSFTLGKKMLGECLRRVGKHRQAMPLRRERWFGTIFFIR